LKLPSDLPSVEIALKTLWAAVEKLKDSEKKRVGGRG
jgi:hypothetical protein